MPLILFLILILFLFSLFYYYNGKIAKQKRQILVLYKQNEHMRNKIKKSYSNNITIQYLNPDIESAIIKDKCPLFIAPINNSAVISYLSKDDRVKILDSALVSNELWYEISIQNIKNINNKGWIKSNFIYTL